MATFEVEVTCTLVVTNTIYVHDVEDEYDAEEVIKELTESGKLCIKYEVEQPGDLECAAHWEVDEVEWDINDPVELDD